MLVFGLGKPDAEDFRRIRQYLEKLKSPTREEVSLEAHWIMGCNGVNRSLMSGSNPPIASGLTEASDFMAASLSHTSILRFVDYVISYQAVTTDGSVTWYITSNTVNSFKGRVCFV